MSEPTGAETGNVSRRNKYRLWRLWLAAPLLLACWLAWVFGARAATMRAYMVPTASMAPAIAPGDRIFVQTHPQRLPRRAEIWVVRTPKGAAKGSQAIIKRVIGLPGETIEVAGGHVIIDGRTLDEPYILAPPGYVLKPVKLGPHEYFMLGDNRDKSDDSHVWGSLSSDHLIGPVEFRYWPTSRMGGP